MSSIKCVSLYSVWRRQVAQSCDKKMGNVRLNDYQNIHIAVHVCRIPVESLNLRPELEIHPTWARNPDEADEVIFRTPDWYRMWMEMKKPE